jgi:hypothetical protein
MLEVNTKYIFRFIYFFHKIIIVIILIATVDNICDDESIDLKVH